MDRSFTLHFSTHTTENLKTHLADNMFSDDLKREKNGIYMDYFHNNSLQISSTCCLYNNINSFCYTIEQATEPRVRIANLFCENAMKSQCHAHIEL